MEEIEKKKISKNGKIMTSIYSSNIRSLVKKANDLKIQRNDIIALLKEGEEVVLVYYK